MVTPRPLRIAIGVSSLIYVLLCLHLPVTLYADARFDDALFTDHAASILAGHWLGGFDQTTLLKGPGFPFFLAANAVLGLPVTLSLAVFYAASCALAAKTVFRLTLSSWTAGAVFLLMEFHPALFPIRVTRDDISPAQLLLLLASLSEFAFFPGTLRRRLGWAVAAGAVLGWFWITREDAFWVVPGVLVMLLGAVLCVRRDRREVLALLAGGAVFLVSAMLIWTAVAAVNFAEYRSFSISDIKNPAFERAVEALQMVRVGAPVPDVPVPAKVRRAIDAVSPAFAALEANFNGPGRGWMEPGCAIDAATCGDFAGGWFVFALRDAVAAQGAYGSEATAAAYYRQISAQVEAACASGRLVCKKPLTVLMPATTAAQWRGLPRDAIKLVALMTWRDGPPAAYDSTGTPAQMAAMETTLNRPRRFPTTAERSALSLAGWYYAASHDWVQISCASPGGASVVPVARYPSPGVAVYVKDPAAIDDRLMFSLDAAAGCALLSTGSPAEMNLPLVKSRAGPVTFPGGELFLDSVQRPPPAGGTFARGILLQISKFYAVLLAPLGILAVSGYVWRAVSLRRRRTMDASFILVSGLWVLLLSRAALLILVDIAAFPAITPVYMLPVFPLFCMSSVLSISLPVLAGLRARLQNPR